MADTAVQEAAQALFISIADGLGREQASKKLNWTKDKNETYDLLENDISSKVIHNSFLKVDPVGVSLDTIKNFLRDKNNLAWYRTCCNTGVAIVNEIANIDKDFAKIQPVGWKDIFYYRGSKAGVGNNVMNMVAALFSKANENDKLFGNVNKWSSADIYLASSYAKEEIKKELTIANDKTLKYRFTNLNKFINKLIDKGELLGISLKKSPEKTTLYRVNFSPSENQKLLDNIEYKSIKSENPRDIRIFFGKNGNNELKIRHDPYKEDLGVNSAIKLEFVGEFSKLGSLTSFGTGISSGMGITDLWAREDPTTAKILADLFKAGLTKYTIEVNKLIAKYAMLADPKKPNLRGKDLKALLKKSTDYMLKGKKVKAISKSNKKEQNLYGQYQDDLIPLSQKFIVDSFKPKIVQFFNATGSSTKIKKNNVILAWFRYSSAMSTASGKFIIAKN